METTDVSHFLALLGRTSTEAGVLVLLVLATQWLFRRQLTPRWRCALWLLVAVRLILPFSFSSATSVFNLLPRTVQMKFSNPALTAPAASATTDRQTMSFLPANDGKNIVNAKTVQAEIAPAFKPETASPAKRKFVWSWPLLIFSIWLAGVLVLAGYVAVSSFRLWRRCVQLPPQSRAWALGILRECCERLQLQHPPALLESFAVGSPALHGLFRPRLLLPKGFTEKFSATELRFVFLHELAHLKRRDLAVNWIVVGLQVIHWFNPLVWFGFARWRAERELACDAMALEAAGEGQNKEYGRTILRLLDHFARPLATPGLVGILEDKRQLRRRIGMIANYVPTQGWPRLAVLLIGLLAVIGLTDPQIGSSSAATSPTTPSTMASPVTPTASSPVPVTPLLDVPPPASSPAILPAASNPIHESKPQIVSDTTTRPQKGNDMNKSSMTNQLARAAVVGMLALATSTTPAAVQAEDAPAAPANSELANQLIGAWILVGTPDHVGKAPSAGGRIKFFTGTHWCITQADAKTGVVLFNHGGTYTLDGDTYYESLEYANSSTITHVGNKNKFTLKIEGDTLTDIGIGNPWKEVWKRLKEPASMSSEPGKNLTGTWAYAGKPGETNAVSADNNRLKFCAGGYWCDIYIDPKTSVVTIHHGGTCTLKGDKYVETCQYANPTSMPLIGEDVKFDIQTEDDTLTLMGVNNPWKEVWKRLN